MEGNKGVKGWGETPDLSLELLVNEVQLNFNGSIKLEGIGSPSVLCLYCTFVR